MQVNSTNVTVGDVNQILLSLGGVIQKPGTDFTVSSSTLTFTTAPAANTSFFAILLGSDNGGTVTPTDESVTTGKLANTISAINNTGGNLVVDVGNEIHLDSDDGVIRFKDGGTQIASFANSSSDFVIANATQDKDIKFQGDDGGSTITALTLDMSDAGKATFNGAVIAGGGNGPTLGFQLKDTSGNPQPRLTNDANNDTVIRPGASGRAIMLANYANNATAINVDDSGHVTMALQPAFQARPSSNQNNMASGDTIVLGTEVFDQNGDFASNTFTAPVTGKYQLSFNIRLQQLQDDSSYALINIQTSNRTYQHILALAPHVDGDVGYQHFSNSLLCDMDANDTAYLVFQESGGTTGAVDVSATESDFTGFLAC
jgi:hypothetical protein